MNLNELIAKYDGKYLEVGGSENAKFQCVDLANGYIMDVLKGDPILGADADMFPDRALGICDWYPYVGQYPESGDMVVWDMGSYGHIAVATGIRNGSKFQTFSQNYPLKSNCHLVDFNLNNQIIGYLRPKKEAEMNCKINDERALHMRRHLVFKTFNLLLGRSGDPKEQEVSDNADWIDRDSGDTFNYQGMADYVVNVYNSDEAKHFRQKQIDSAVQKATAGLFTAEQVKTKVNEAVKGLIDPKNCPKTEPTVTTERIVIESVIWNWIKSKLGVKDEVSEVSKKIE